MGKKAKRRQRAQMNEMNELAQEQFEYQQKQQVAAQGRVDAQRKQYESFEFSNPFAGTQNPYADLQTDFQNLAGDLTNVYGGASNVYAGAENVFAGAQNTFAGMDNAYAGLENQFAGMENAYAGLQNQYEGMENRFEDLTVDMRAADFQAQQGAQQRANIMQGLRGAAGSSGVAGLAQAMANQGQLQAQQIAAGIGQQERQNQMLAAREGSRIDQLQRGAGMQLQQLQAGGAMSIQQAERAGAAQLQGQVAAADMSNQQLAAQGAMQAQQMQMQGAAQQQQMILGGAADLQRMQLGGAERLQAQQLQSAERARALGIDRENLAAQGQYAADMAVMQGDAAVQAAEFGRESTLLGMEYGTLTGANQALSGAMANQMSGMGMTANMYGSQAQGSMNLIGDLAKTAAIKYAFLCVPKGVKIDSIDKTIAIEDIKPGDIVIGYSGEPVKVLQKHEYLEDPTKERFYKVKFDNGSIVNVCDMHEIKGVAAKDITENVVDKEIHGDVEFSYDLLTEDLGYRIGDIPVNSMIPKMAMAITEKIKNK